MTELERPRLYLETSVISYLAARPSRDLLVAANQQITHEWWSKQRAGFQVFVSRWVVREISVGDPGVSEARVAIIAGLPRLEVTDRGGEPGGTADRNPRAAPKCCGRRASYRGCDRQ
jgi:hypothetical protein